MTLFFPILKAPAPFSKRGVKALDSKTIYKNSYQILALEVLLFLKSKKKNRNIVCHNNISPPVILGIIV